MQAAGITERADLRQGTPLSKRASLSEIMGSDAAEKGSAGELRLEHLPEILGDAMPDMPKNAVGRYRLLRSLKARFGPNFRSLPGVTGLLKQFDGVLDTERTIHKIRSLKAEKK